MDLEKLATDVPAEVKAAENVVNEVEAGIEDVKAGHIGEAIKEAEAIPAAVEEVIKDGEAIAQDL